MSKELMILECKILLKQKTVKELKELAREHNVGFNSRTVKRDLVYALSQLMVK